MSSVNRDLGRALRRSRVLATRRPGPGAFVLRLARGDVHFAPGQYVSLGLPDAIDMREYSVYSPPSDDYLEILVKEVAGGAVSPALARQRPGDEVTLKGPFGEFLIDPEARARGKFLFVATGSGIAPFHCFVRAYPEIDFMLLHGVRTLADRYESEIYDLERYVACVSRDQPAPGAFPGRVTDYLRQRPPIDSLRGRDLYCYLCGSCDMIYEVMAILVEQGIPRERIFAEVYY